MDYYDEEPPGPLERKLADAERANATLRARVAEQDEKIAGLEADGRRNDRAVSRAYAILSCREEKDCLLCRRPRYVAAEPSAELLIDLAAALGLRCEQTAEVILKAAIEKIDAAMRESD